MAGAGMGQVFVGRSGVFAKLKSLLTQSPTGRLTLISVEGSGGVGKTTLIREVLGSVDLPSKGFLIMELRGEDFFSNERPKDPVTVLAEATYRTEHQLPKDNQPYFRLTRMLKEANDQIEASLQKELLEKNDEFTDTLRDAAKALIDGGKGLGDYIPKVKDYVDTDKLSEIDTKEIEEFIEKGAAVYKLGTGITDYFWRWFSDEAVNQDRLVRDVWSTLGEDFVSDLAAILSGYKKKDSMKLLPEKVNGFDQFFFFIDDYESIQNSFGKMFVVRQLLLKLKDAPFKSTLLVSGRDDFSSNDPTLKDFAQQLSDNRIPLHPLELQAVKELLQAHNIDGNLDELAKTIYDETEGYPFLVEMALEDGRSDSIPALALKKFYDRQTHWMTPVQKRWLDHLSFLDEVNLDTIPRVLPAEDVKEILEWFQKEGSIRDELAPKWTVRPFVRTRVLKYLESISPSESNRLREAAMS